jgi:hypothetical protein
MFLLWYFCKQVHHLGTGQYYLQEMNGLMCSTYADCHGPTGLVGPGYSASRRFSHLRDMLWSLYNADTSTRTATQQGIVYPRFRRCCCGFGTVCQSGCQARARKGKAAADPRRRLYSDIPCVACELRVASCEAALRCSAVLHSFFASTTCRINSILSHPL